MQKEKFEYRSWKEYPERDIEYVRYYPPTVGPLDGGRVWEKKEMGLYLQIPFCKSICKYCPFNKYPWKEDHVRRYLNALKKEIKMIGDKPTMKEGTVSALNFGGGTPTSLTTDQFIGLLDHCKQHFDIAPSAEISIEANPETADENKLKALLDWGVNRISFGVQSFNDCFLKMVGRAHKAEQSAAAIKTARRLGLENIGIDLLYRIPGQTVTDWENELDRAVELEIDHISIFSLLLNPGTQLFKERLSAKVPPQPGEETEIAMYERAMEKLSQAGYRHYIVYDFALPGKECEYHSICWQVPQREYPGLGAGANSYLQGYLYTNINPLDQYIRALENDHLPVSFGRKLTREDEISRALVLGTKFLHVGKKEFKEQFGVEMDDVFGDIILRLENWGLITNNQDAIDITPKGMIYMSNVNKAFYGAEHKGKPQPIAVKLQQGETHYLDKIKKINPQEVAK
jgi:oxygen-independent coproporphyrinogen-3 oxidase